MLPLAYRAGMCSRPISSVVERRFRNPQTAVRSCHRAPEQCASAETGRQLGGIPGKGFESPGSPQDF